MREEEQLIAKWEESRWLILSSCSMLLPSIYAYYKSMYFYSYFLFITVLMSINFWRKPTYSLRRDLDLYFSKICFFIYFYNGVTYVRYLPYIITGYPIAVLAISSFYYSGNKYNLRHADWYIYHSLFHYMIMYEGLIIIDSI